MTFQASIPIALALSGERPGSEFIARYDGVGLVRSEYLFRELLAYPTEEDAQQRLYEYMCQICADTCSSVGYRTMEVTGAEANVLRGVEQQTTETIHDLTGLRGVRRHMKFPASLDAELDVLKSVLSTHSNLHLIAPFVSSVDEYVWYRDRVQSHLGADVGVGTMIEVPSLAFSSRDLLGAGATRVVVGSNDLTSLLGATSRRIGARTRLIPGMGEALAFIRAALPAQQVHISLAGYVDDALLSAAENAGLDAVILHYADLHNLLGVPLEELPEVAHLQTIKSRTRKAIALRAATAQSSEGPIN